MNKKAIQERYEAGYSHCYGCGTLNEDGLQIKSYWDGKESICEFHPKSYHIAMPGYVYGGLIASIIDCHSIGTAAAAAHQDRGLDESAAYGRFVTASLHVNYLRPTPTAEILTLKSTIKEVKGRKVVVETALFAKGICCAKAETVAVEVPDEMTVK